jgi:hypothetical protein
MGKAAEGLSRSYLKQIYVTCLARSFAFVLETARMLYPILDSLMAKGRHCEITSYSVALTNKTPVTPLPPTPMITSWGTWVDIFVFCAGN